MRRSAFRCLQALSSGNAATAGELGGLFGAWQDDFDVHSHAMQRLPLPLRAYRRSLPMCLVMR